MSILVNGKVHPLPEPRTLAALLRFLSPAAPFAVARNEEIIPRETYEECPVVAGDKIEVVHPTAGG
ncbi:MAG: sulfur carrier protein ThiS [Terriglobales bacterium]